MTEEATLTMENVGRLRPTLFSDRLRTIGRYSDRPKIRCSSDFIRIDCRTRKALKCNDLRKKLPSVRPSDGKQGQENKISGSGNGDAASSG